MNGESKVTEATIRLHLNQAHDLFGWPRHIEDPAAAEKLGAVWRKLFEGRDADQFNRAFDAALRTGRYFPAPADVEELMHDRCVL